MIEVTANKTDHVRALFADMEQHAVLAAIFAGDVDAQIFVDDASQPRAGMIFYNGRFIFDGDARQADFNAQLRDYIGGTLIPNHHSDWFMTRFGADDWMPVLRDIFPGRNLFGGPRLYFESPARPVAQVALPEGFTLKQVTRELLESNLRGLDALREEMCSERLSVEDFLQKSFGLCPVYGNEIVGWCLSEYNVHDRCEIGIAVLDPHKRKGCATALAQSFLADAHARGYRRVGWDCWENNEASAATARKAGFELVCREQALVIILE